MPPTVINADVCAAIKAFCEALPPLKPRDVGQGHGIAYLQDCANRALAQADSPLNSEWLSELVRRGTADDLNAMDAAFAETNTEAAINLRYRFMQRLLPIAYGRDQEGMEVSAEIPAWYEASGWWRAAVWPTYLWNCEERLQREQQAVERSQIPEPTS
jgi:hypothetical protein